MTDPVPELTQLRRLVDRAIDLGSRPKVRLILLLIVGLVAWLLVLFNFPLEDAVPRYAEF